VPKGAHLTMLALPTIDTNTASDRPLLPHTPVQRRYPITYMPKLVNDSYTRYKKQHLTDGLVYVLKSTCTIPIPPSHIDSDADSYNVFSAFPDLPLTDTTSLQYAFPAVDSKADTLTQSQMLRDTDRDKFVQSQTSEIASIQKMDVFEVHPIQTKPSNAHLLSSIWSYKRKRSPVGTILKHKSRLCMDGSQQLHGRDFWETYVLVNSWPTIRLILLLANILNLKSCQVNYTQAFPQAPLQDPVFMRIPQGWYADSTGTLKPHPDPKYYDRDHYIKLKKNLYGCKQAARNWFEYLKSGLLAHGFRQSSFNPCLYFRDDCLMVMYTDDCLIFTKDDLTIDTLLRALSSQYLIKDQGNVPDYLNICITKDPVTCEIHKSQPGLIESILSNLNLLHD
jgi:hypothetical protein